eukprot:4965842-Prymnesium_polylepis.2
MCSLTTAPVESGRIASGTLPRGVRPCRVRNSMIAAVVFGVRCKAWKPSKCAMRRLRSSALQSKCDDRGGHTTSACCARSYRACVHPRCG